MSRERGNTVIHQEDTGGDTGGKGFSSAFWYSLYCELLNSAQIELVKTPTYPISKGFSCVSVLDGTGIYSNIVKQSHGVSCH